MEGRAVRNCHSADADSDRSRRSAITCELRQFLHRQQVHPAANVQRSKGLFGREIRMKFGYRGLLWKPAARLVREEANNQFREIRAGIDPVDFRVRLGGRSVKI